MKRTLTPPAALAATGVVTLACLAALVVTLAVA
jgi:hypothetical protein